MGAPEDTVKLISAESERLTQYLTTLSPEAWRTPSACERWQVRDVVAQVFPSGEHAPRGVCGEGRRRGGARPRAPGGR